MVAVAAATLTIWALRRRDAVVRLLAAPRAHLCMQSTTPRCIITVRQTDSHARHAAVQHALRARLEAAMARARLSAERDKS
eukprot:SAG31_NODE_2639_length_5327_cov_15.148240_7_plen_81_part_00